MLSPLYAGQGPHHQSSLAQHVVDGLRYVSRVQIVVVRVLELAVALLYAAEKVLEDRRRHLGENWLELDSVG